MASELGITTWRTLPLPRWAGLGVLFAAEITVLTVWFDTGVLVHERGAVARLIGRAHYVPQIAIAAAAAAVLLGGARLGAVLHRTGFSVERPRWFWWLVVGQITAFAAFAATTSLLFERTSAGSFHALPVAVAWGSLGLGVVVLWAATLLPAQQWLAIATHGWGTALAGAGLGAVAWAAGQSTSSLWGSMTRTTFWMVRWLLEPAFHDVVARPADGVIGTSKFAVTISPQCSGFEGIGLIWVALGAYLWLFRRTLRFPRALVLLPAGTVIIWLANGVRIAALIAIGTYLSPAVAIGGFHSQAGWIAFNVVALGLAVAAQRIQWFRAEHAPSTDTRASTNPSVAYLAPLLAIVAVSMVCATFTSGFDGLYPLRVLAAAAVLVLLRHEYADWRWERPWEAIAIGAAAFGLWMALEPGAVSTGVPEALASLPKGWATAWLAFRVVGSIITVPIAEELAFRGYLTRRLISRDFQVVPLGRFSWPSFLGSSALFGALHGRWLAGGLAGMLYALALYRRGRITDAVIAHAVTNALIAAYVLSTGAWSLWG